MDLKINPNARTITEGLGLTNERVGQLCEMMSGFIMPQFKEKKDIDKLELFKFAAEKCDTLEEYTMLCHSIDVILEETFEKMKREEKEEHEKHCPFCKARKEREQRSRQGFPFSFGDAGAVKEISPGVFVIRL